MKRVYVQCVKLLTLRLGVDHAKFYKRKVLLHFVPGLHLIHLSFGYHQKNTILVFSKISQKEINDLSLILRSTLRWLDLNKSKIYHYNLVFHLSPEKKNSRQIHWHIEVYPLTDSLVRS